MNGEQDQTKAAQRLERGGLPKPQARFPAAADRPQLCGTPLPHADVDEETVPKTSPRARAREAAFQLLFHWDVNPDFATGQVERFVWQAVPEEAAARFALELVEGVVSLKDRLDEEIQAVSENWAVSRMAVADRAILRLATFELLYTDTPGEVIIDQAVELAKRFGTAQSGAFVNGILDRLMHTVRGSGSSASKGRRPEARRPGSIGKKPQETPPANDPGDTGRGKD